MKERFFFRGTLFHFSYTVSDPKLNQSIDRKTNWNKKPQPSQISDKKKKLSNESSTIF